MPGNVFLNSLTAFISGGFCFSKRKSVTVFVLHAARGLHHSSPSSLITQGSKVRYLSYIEPYISNIKR
jgi:hypothetical protein